MKRRNLPSILVWGGSVLAVVMVAGVAMATADSLPPTISAISPEHGPEAGGTQVAISGLNFTGATDVTFAGREASFTVNSDNSITAVSPPVDESMRAQIAVLGPGGESSPISPELEFVYGPAIERLEPKRGPAAGGTTVTILGQGLESATAVSFGVTPASAFTNNSDGSITATSPPFAGGLAAVPVTVTTPEGVSTAGGMPDQLPANDFIYGPTVTDVEPNSGPMDGGTKVTVRGSGFRLDSLSPLMSPPILLHFGPTNLVCFPSPECEVESGTEIIAIAPPGAGSVDLTVETPGGVSPAGPADLFHYIPFEGVQEHSVDGDLMQLVICQNVNDQGSRNLSRSRKRHADPPDQICSTKLTTRSIGPGAVVARLIRGDTLFATGTATIIRAKTRLSLNPVRPIGSGRYRLALYSQRSQWHETIVIR